jgi:glyoxylase-like metal-dependent hydrolase (beta-lactamase superfamily II)
VAELVVRGYNVGFGDAIHVEVPDRDASGAEVIRHLVIDVGNVLSGVGADDTLFPPVVQDIARRTGGRVDLYVLSHEHLDHAQGLFFASRSGINLVVDHVWLPGSAAPGYYQTHPAARANAGWRRLSSSRIYAACWRRRPDARHHR